MSEDLRGQVRAALLALCDGRVIDMAHIHARQEDRYSPEKADDLLAYPKGFFDGEDPAQAFRLGDLVDAVMDVVERDHQD